MHGQGVRARRSCNHQLAYLGPNLPVIEIRLMAMNMTYPTAMHAGDI